MIRVAFPDYVDGIGEPPGANRPNARVISNTISAQEAPVTNDRGLSDFIWQWGQFIDHDITLTDFEQPYEAYDISMDDAGDPLYSPGDPYIHLVRSQYASGTGVTTPRQQMNSNTSFIDASMVYGSNLDRDNALRSFSGGRLLTSTNGLLPFNTMGLYNFNEGPFPDDELRAGGTCESMSRLPSQPCTHCS